MCPRCEGVGRYAGAECAACNGRGFLMEALRGLDLFSGSGVLGCAFRDGLLEGLGIPSRTVAYCEWADYPQAVLLSRMRRGEIDTAPICSDIRELRGADLGPIDFIIGGWPCQGNSLAGSRKGMEDERSALVVEVVRLVRELGPSLVFLENVPGVLTAPGDGVGFVADALAGLGYELRWTDLSAADVGQAHERRRFWLMAYASRDGATGEPGGVQQANGGPLVGLPRQLERGGEELGVADAEQSGRGRKPSNPEGDHGDRPQAGWDQGANRPQWVGESLGQPAHIGHERPRSPRGRRSGPADPSGRLGDHHGLSGGEVTGVASGPSGHSRQPSEAVGHGIGAGLEERPSLAGDHRKERQAAERGGLPMVPPSRFDREGWERVIALGLDAEPTLRRVAPRLAFRADRIRVIGNGVDYRCAKAAAIALLGR